MLLQKGDSGTTVTYLQYGLRILCCYSGTVDGVFGDTTYNSVVKFQHLNGLIEDGIVGDTTWSQLKDEIKIIQTQLNTKGLNVGVADGVAGPATYEGVMNFQKNNGLVADGMVGPATWDLLFGSISNGADYSRVIKVTSPLMKGEDIRAIQDKLNYLGYKAGTADGIYGNTTKEAVIQFQIDKGLTADGIVGSMTWNKIFSSSPSESGYSRLIKVTSPLMRGDDVRAVQNRLSYLGYNVGTIDGIYGNTTKEVVIQFQIAQGIGVDGVVGPSTWRMLFSSSANGTGYSRVIKVTSPLMRGEDIKSVQRKLNYLGYNAGTADGVYGNTTKEAVIQFQLSKNLTADGVVGPATWKALFGSSASGGNNGIIGSVTGNIRKVFIDPGHGGTDPGAEGNGLVEKTVALSIAKKIGNILVSKGISVTYSREGDTYLTLSERAQKANSWGADLFVSIHCNSFNSSSAAGTECYTYANASEYTKCLSKNISSSISSALNVSNRGHKEANFAVLRLTNMPAVLVETAFISNGSDALKLKNNQDLFASTIANQILSSTSLDSNNTKELLRQASSIGLLKDVNVEIEAFNYKVPIGMISYNPRVTAEAEITLTSTINS
ncbi:MAG: peptidoglycan-binding protein [Clostridium sp.]